MVFLEKEFRSKLSNNKAIFLDHSHTPDLNYLLTYKICFAFIFVWQIASCAIEVVRSNEKTRQSTQAIEHSEARRRARSPPRAIRSTLRRAHVPQVCKVGLIATRAGGAAPDPETTLYTLSVRAICDNNPYARQTFLYMYLDPKRLFKYYNYLN